MKLLICFSEFDADIIDVPLFVLEKKNKLSDRFIKWLYDKDNDHGFWDSKKSVVNFRSEAFVFWINQFVLKDSKEQAVVLEKFVSEYDKELPSLWF